MTEKDTGGPAFPHKEYLGHDCFAYYNGMTLRDWFAGQALTGLFAMGANQGFVDCQNKARQENGMNTPEYLAYLAYLAADEMLKARGES